MQVRDETRKAIEEVATLRRRLEADELEPKTRATIFHGSTVTKHGIQQERRSTLSRREDAAIAHVELDVLRIGHSDAHPARRDILELSVTHGPLIRVDRVLALSPEANGNDRSLRRRHTFERAALKLLQFAGSLDRDPQCVRVPFDAQHTRAEHTLPMSRSKRASDGILRRRRLRVRWKFAGRDLSRNRLGIQ